MSDPVQTQPVAVAEKVGPLLSPWALETGAVATLQTWAWPSYVEEVERQNGLEYGSVQQVEQASIRGAGDLDEWMSDELPVILVVCQKPDGKPEAYASNGYVATYILTVGAITIAPAEDEEWLARRDAGLIATACMGAIGQQLATDHPDLVVDVRMDDVPQVRVVDEDIRTEWEGQVTFSVTVAPVLDQTLGMDTPTVPGGIPTDYPTAETTNLTLDVVPIDESVG